MALTRTQVLGNEAGECGGGLYVSNGSVTLTGGQVRDNAATGVGWGDAGGGMYLSLGSATLSSVPIVENTAQDGGGFFNWGGTLTLVNATVSHNAATNDGGGLYGGIGTTVLTYTTVASNTAMGRGGGVLADTGVAALGNTVLAYNDPSNCEGILTSSGHNLESGTTCGLNATGDITGTDPLLAPLAEDGGTLVHALVKDSPAIDEGLCLVEPAIDQRGVSRPQGDACDIGAYEFYRINYVT